MSNDPRPIVHFLFEPGNGGLDRVAILLANGMAERGLPAELWLSRRKGPLAHLISDRVTVRDVPTVNIGKRGLKLVLQLPALAKMIRQYQPAAIFSAGNQSNLSIAIARRMARASNIKIIQKITNPIIRPNMDRIAAAMRVPRFRFTAAMGDMCLTLSEADTRAYSRLMPSVADRFHAVRNPYVSDEMLGIGSKRRSATASDNRNLLAVGRLDTQKDYPTMFRSLARLKDRQWHLRILGNGPHEHDLKQLAADLGIADRITFAGFVPDPGKAYAGSDILLLSSRWEGLPAVPLEALACGCDVVTTACAEGLTDVLEPLGQPVVEIEDDAALAREIEVALDRNGPPAAGREIAARYSIAASVDHHLELLAQL